MKQAGCKRATQTQISKRAQADSSVAYDPSTNAGSESHACNHAWTPNPYVTAGPQRQTQTLRKCSARLTRHHSHCEKLSYKAQCLSGGKKQTLSHSSGPRLIVPYKSLFGQRHGIIDKKTDLFVSPALLSRRHVNRTQCEFHPSEQCCSGIFLALKCLKIKHNAVFFH